MSAELTNQIIIHIMENLGINSNKSKSLISKDYLLPEKLSFETDSEEFENSIWGCQFVVENKSLKLLLGNSSISKHEKEYCLIVHLEDSPTYGLYLSEIDKDQNIIAFSVSGKDWMKCSVYLQATFLAGIEQIRDIGFPQEICKNYKNEYDSMISFINYRDNQEVYEGQES